MIAAKRIRNKRSAGSRRFVCLAVLFNAVLAFVCLSVAGEFSYAAPSDGLNNSDGLNKDALGGHEYPWYDAQTRSVKPLEQKPGKKSMSTERETVPIAKPKPGGTGGTTNFGRGVGTGTGTAGDGAGTMFFVITAAIILVVIVVLVLTFLYIESRESDLSLPSGRSRKQSIEQLPFDLDSLDGDFRAAADAAYQSGDLRKAIIYLYSHILVTLDQNRLIRLRKGKTNRQYLREVQRHKGVSGYFQQVMLPFESVFFGDHEMDADQFQQCWSGLNGFHSKVKDNSEILLG